MRVETLMSLVLGLAAWACTSAVIQSFVDIGKAGTTSTTLELIFDIVPVAIGLGVIAIIWRGDDGMAGAGPGAPPGY